MIIFIQDWGNIIAIKAERELFLVEGVVNVNEREIELGVA